jgi:adenine-specific DNA-methyltransferase
MNQKEQLIHSGFQILETENQDNKLLQFLKENYPSIIRDNEINLNELKTLSGLPVDEKVSGYGLNFIGRNVARAKYANKTTKEVKVNHNQSKNFDTTQNLVLKGDNLESLKILKSHYSGAIKCIYIDPPYNTKNDEFVYPDKFDKDEAEVLGLANVSETDMERMEFSFKTKQSHNGWLSFMYPRLLLARDLLAKDGVIFISIDDNEQANLKLLCDEIFGEENFVANLIWEKKFSPSNDAKWFSDNHDHILVYSKIKEKFKPNLLERTVENLNRYKNPDNDIRGAWVSGDMTVKTYNSNYDFVINTPSGRNVSPLKGICWRFSKEKIDELIKDNRIWFGNSGDNVPRLKRFLTDVKEGITPLTIWYHKDVAHNQEAVQDLRKLFDGELFFETPKPERLLKRIIYISTDENDIILDFFAGSGTTGQAVMQLNAEDGGNRKFILCQIDEPIRKDKPAYQFCVENNLPPVISSITIERLNRAGEKIKKEIEIENTKTGIFEENKKQIPDIGYKVFDTTNALELEMEVNGQIVYPSLDEDALSRIYNMIFSVGIDSPVSSLECVVENCIYKIGNHYYITNSADANNEDITNAIKNGKVFVDGWSAGINITLQHYKEDVKIVF